MKLFYLLLTSLSTSIALELYAQDQKLGTWNILHIDAQFNKKWGAFAEGQIRSLKYYDHFHYYEYKGALEYSLQENATLSLGFGQYRTFDEGGTFVRPLRSDELRLWPQFLLKQSIKKLKFEHRYRTEFRFTNNGYRNRFRLRFGASYPILSRFIKTGNLEIKANNEVFFTNRAPYFERNRSQLLFEYKFNDNVQFTLGYLHQFDYQIFDEIGRDFVVVGISYLLDFSGKKE
jgi:hypothetical protein